MPHGNGYSSVNMNTILKTWFISQKTAIDCGNLLRIAQKSSTQMKSIVTEPAKTKSKETNKLDKTTAKVSSKGDKSRVKNIQI